MSQTKIIISAVVTLILIGGGYILFASNKAGSNGTQVETEVTPGGTEVVVTSGKKMAFSEFMKQGGSYKCTVTQNVNNTDTKGLTYIDGSMIRGEYNISTQGMSITSTLIVRDGYTYTWTSMAPSMGFKAKVVESTEADANTGMSGTYSFDANEIGDYDCAPWTPDARMFTLPTGVTFTEIK